jgi:hypothetical protein
MSTQRGNVKKQAPAHQNSFAFYHNPKSKKTAKILASPIVGLCDRCHEKIEWRKKYRKYKPRTVPGRCENCQQKTVTRAYHVYCDACAKESKKCAMCREVKDLKAPIITKKEELEEKKALQEALDDMTG